MKQSGSSSGGFLGSAFPSSYPRYIDALGLTTSQWVKSPSSQQATSGRTPTYDLERVPVVPMLRTELHTLYELVADMEKRHTDSEKHLLHKIVELETELAILNGEAWEPPEPNLDDGFPPDPDSN